MRNKIDFFKKMDLNLAHHFARDVFEYVENQA